MEDNFNLRNEIRTLFISLNGGDISYELRAGEKNAYYVTDGNMKGVGLEIDEKFKDFRYSFNNIKIKVAKRLNSQRELKYFIMILSEKLYDRNEFITLCMNFIELGKNDENRNMLLNNPQDWVDNWRTLLGNENTDERIYPYLGELIVLRELLKNGEKALLTNYGSHDIESENGNYEIKSTVSRYNSLIEIHSKNQLLSLNDNQLYLIFVRLEKSNFGETINSVIKDLENLKYDVTSIIEKVREYNSESLDISFKVDEIRKYVVDDAFPKIVDESFTSGHLPVNIRSLTYVIDLNGLEYTLL